MGLIKKIFGSGNGGGNSESKPAPEFEDSKPPAADDARQRKAARRELVHNVLRETMRKHGIPSDWIGCRVLAVVSRTRKAGVHVQFIVRKGDDQLLRYIHQFQEGFMREIERVEPSARQWIFSVAWQFDGSVAGEPLPVAGAAAPATPVVPAQIAAAAAEGGDEDTLPEAGDTLPAEDDAVDLESDLQALYAIRDAAMSSPVVPLGGSPGTRNPG